MRLGHSVRCAAILVLGCVLALSVQAGARFERIRAQGFLVCGVAPNDPGFSQRTQDGNYTGLESDLCRALASAILGGDAPVHWQPLETVHEFLSSPSVDIVFHRLTWTLLREAPGQLEFGPVYFYEATQSGILEPLAPLLRSDDNEFARVVRWSVQALLEAEWLGIGQRDVRGESWATYWPTIGSGASLSLSPDWAKAMVERVGNYGEIYERHFGPQSSAPLARGVNRLQRDGGLFVPPPLR